MSSVEAVEPAPRAAALSSPALSSLSSPALSSLSSPALSSPALSSLSSPALSSPALSSLSSPALSSLSSPPAGRPLLGLRLASHAVLQEAQQRGRLKCSKCGGSRMFFCYTCCSLLGVDLQDIPLIKLPVKIDIIKHPNETDGKSTAVHARILAPADVTIYTYPCFPDYEKAQVVLVFPGPGAVSVRDMMRCLRDMAGSRSPGSCSQPCRKRLKAEAEAPGASPLQRVVFIDSTWNQTNKISSDERLQGLLRVELKTRKTCFWRSQKGKPDTYLATIEAIYYFLKDFREQCLAQEYDGEYDNLLFFYSYLHSVVNKAKTSAGKS